jgi:N-glycosylase/DNA lyase
MKTGGLIREYKLRKGDIRRRLKEFESMRKAPDADIFGELCFCLLTPQSKAVNCAKAIDILKKKSLITKGSARRIGSSLRGLVRFHNKKAEYLTLARRRLCERNGPGLRWAVGSGDNRAAREWLVENVKGLGYKEASHFLRNIGRGRGLAILDRHILKNLKRFGALSTLPVSPGSRKTYMELEGKAAVFAKRIGVPLEELDLLFWSLETGFIFK